VIQSSARNTVVVFDLDDTLYPEHDFVISGFQAVDEELRRRDIDGFFPTAQRLFQGGLRGTIFNAALEKLNVEPTAKLVSELVQIYRNHTPRLQLFPDARWALNHYSASAPIGLLTDGFAQTQRNKVRALGLDTRFRAAMYTGDLGPEQQKPSLVPFQKIATLLGIQEIGQRMVYVADNPKKDFIAPNQLGWLTVRIQRGTGEYTALEPLEKHHAAHHEICTLEELPQILNS
jgi:putative hydrolase of the HAD superfamily